MRAGLQAIQPAPNARPVCHAAHHPRYTAFVTFDPLYVSNVLRVNFNDAKALFLGPLLRIHSAHLVMLSARGIIGAADASALRRALDSISIADVQQTWFDGTSEDLFFHIEQLIAVAAGDDVAGRLHTARSRNDVDMTMYRMRQRECIAELADAVTALRTSLLDVAAAHRQTVFAALTHTQRAQPTTMAHYLLAVVEQLERDTVRLRAAYTSTNRCPLGSCAITGTGFPIDRQLTSDLLGFDGPTGNTYGSIATVDYLLESMSAIAVMLVGLGRVLQDLLLWCTAEFGYLRLSEGFVQCSSIMPQKRNPVALEHARAIGSTAVGQAQAVILTVHNTPFGDIVDTEDDLQPLVESTFADATRAVRVTAAALRDAEFNQARLEAAAGESGTTLTELADHIVREHGVSFRTAHAITARLSATVSHGVSPALAERLAEASRELTGQTFDYTEEQLADILSPRHFVEVRTTPGGPAPSETAIAIERSRASLISDAGWFQVTHERMVQAAALLRDRLAAL
jgi:argininosuccinate lyase